VYHARDKVFFAKKSVARLLRFSEAVETGNERRSREALGSSRRCTRSVVFLLIFPLEQKIDVRVT
jgi:hypothetical protein